MKYGSIQSPIPAFQNGSPVTVNTPARNHSDRNSRADARSSLAAEVMPSAHLSSAIFHRDHRDIGTSGHRDIGIGHRTSDIRTSGHPDIGILPHGHLDNRSSQHCSWSMVESVSVRA